MSVSRHRDAPRRAVARRRSASAFFAAALVLLCAVASAGTGLGGSVAALDDSTEVAGQGPDWPFRGIIRNVYSEPDGHPVLRFEWGLLAAGDTGEVVGCDFAMGTAMGGLTFVLPEGSRLLVDEFALPRPYQGECGGLDLRMLPPARAASEAGQ